MSEAFGPDIITITDEDGVEYVLEVLHTMEIDGRSYCALTPVAEADEDENLEVSILRIEEEDGEEVFCAIEDEDELDRVYELMITDLFSEEHTEE